MGKILKYAFVLMVVLLAVSLSVSAKDEAGGEEAEAISFESGVESEGAEDPALKNIKITQNGPFDESDIQRCREVIGEVLLGKNDNPDIDRFSDLDPVSIGDMITAYTEGNFIYIVADPSPGMNQLYGYELVSKDDGNTWVLNQFHRVLETGDMYIIDGNIMYIDGIGMELVSAPVISADTGKSYKELDAGPVKKIMSLPSMEGCCCYAKVKGIDKDRKTIDFDWYINNYEAAENCCRVYNMTAKYPSFEISGKKDLSGLEQEAAQYMKTGYLFEKSGSEKLNREAVAARFLKEYRLAGAQKTAAEIRLAINEIYARKGQDFQDKEIREYFAGKKWYKPLSGKAVKEEELNEIEQYNIRLLVGLEKEYKAAVIQ